MKKKIVIVVNAVGLSPALLEGMEKALNLSALAAGGTYRPMEPTFPALTSSVQATLLTGKPPADHGIVGNGWFFQNSMRPEFWKQEGALVRGPRIWDIVHDRDPASQVAVLFWQNSMYIDADVVITPSPLHALDRTVEWCYSKPPGLYERLVGEIGPFRLAEYWGPKAGEGSSRWIAKAALQLLRSPSPPDVLLVYLPHLDYVSQRHGPDSSEALGELPVLDDMIGEFMGFIDEYGRTDAVLFVVSEYGLVPVHRAVFPNQVLRKAGLLSVRKIDGGVYIDFELSKAFAVVDHQVAHVYCRDRESERQAREALSCAEGVARVIGEEGKQALEVNHPRSGDLILLAETDSWFHYKYWAGDLRAPFFAGSVDIHNKPGYDPCELFFDPATKAISTDTALVKGSHGLLPEGRKEAQAVMICSDPSLNDYAPPDFKATQFLGMLYRVM